MAHSAYSQPLLQPLHWCILPFHNLLQHHQRLHSRAFRADSMCTPTPQPLMPLNNPILPINNPLEPLQHCLILPFHNLLQHLQRLHSRPFRSDSMCTPTPQSSTTPKSADSAFQQPFRAPPALAYSTFLQPFIAPPEGPQAI